MIPTIDTCDTGEPDQFARWALVCLPGTEHSGAPLLVAPQVLAAWSQHLWDCGFRHHPEYQKKDYVLPDVEGYSAPDASFWAQSAGKWVERQ